MDDDTNLNPNGEFTDTPADSQSGTITSDDSTTVNPQGAEGFSSEEAIWDNLSGPSKDRFKQMARMANEAEERARRAELRATDPSYAAGVPTPITSNSTQTPEVTDAVRKLSDFGLATKDEVEQKITERVNQSVGALAYRYELDRLENKYSGADGKPAFSREEYENFINANPNYRNYQPEDVYEKMFPEELFEYRLKNHNRPTPRQNSSLRPTKTQVREEQWTPEAIEAKLQTMSEGDRVAWVDKNKGLIDTVLGRTSAD